MLFWCLDLNIYSAPLNVSERLGSEIKQPSVAIGMARKQSWNLYFTEKPTSHGSL